MMSRRIWIATVLAVVLATFGAVATQERQNTAAPAERPRRIISLVPAVTEMLFAIGAGPDVVGISSYDRFPPEALSRPKVGALIDPDFELILSLRPDLVIVYGTQGDLQGRLDRARIPQFDYEHAGLADITRTIRRLGTRIGRGAEAERVAAGMERDLDAIRREVEGKPRPRTVLIIGREPGALRGIYASGGRGFMHDMLELAGGENVFANVLFQNMQVSTEMLLANAPEVILETVAPEGWTAERVEKELAIWSLLPSLPAVRTKRTYLLTDEVLLVPGPRVATGVRLMADVLHPKGASR